MSGVPVTYLFDFMRPDENEMAYAMHEFAVNGAKHLVLSDTLIRRIMEDRSLQDTLLKQMEAEGLSFRDAHAPFGLWLDLNCPEGPARPQMLMRQKLSMQITADMGVDTITIHVGNETKYPDCPLETQIESVRKSLAELLPLAEELGLTICIENIWHRINTPERLLAWKKEFPTDALGFCYDAGHANLMTRERSREAAPFYVWGELYPQFDEHILEKMLPHVVNCHLHDNNGLTDQHLNRGAGTVDWPKVLSLLKTAPRLKVIQSEVIPVRTHTAIRDVCAAFADL